MAELLKNMYFTQESIELFADQIKQEYIDFDSECFIKRVFCDDWSEKELKQKMWHTTKVLQEFLPESYDETLKIFCKIAPYIKGFKALCLPDYVEQFGLEFPEKSLPALREFTKYSTSEFAIRPFILMYPDLVMEKLLKWADDPNENIRRWTSEGCRPRLPWSIALPIFKNNPDKIFPILSKLMEDESEFVRKSVANNLNDISKDNPEKMMDFCDNWFGKSANTNWIIKHGCRTLLKSGYKRALLLFGYCDPNDIEVVELSLSKQKIKIGEELTFQYKIIIPEGEKKKIRLEYDIYYQKKKGKVTKKTYKISERDFTPGIHKIIRKQSFADISTRKHNVGKHEIAVKINSEVKSKAVFSLEK